MKPPSGNVSSHFRPLLRFRKGYALAAAALLAIEILIALLVDDSFVRPYFGDTLAVALVYCALRATLALRPFPAAALALAVAVVIEFGQYLHVLRLVGLEGNAFARTVLGTGFEPRDFLAYAAGALAVLAIEAARTQPKA
ncbi:MAG: DUF2809 domain-containing protein [Sphingopyxis sp.]|nr:DUF2809 domain-containing protein [Sphingopyxis sp.]